MHIRVTKGWGVSINETSFTGLRLGGNANDAILRSTNGSDDHEGVRGLLCHCYEIHWFNQTDCDYISSS